MIKILLFVLIPLVFFGAGVLFASLVWGKYKQLAITLRQRNDALAKRESQLDEAHAQAKARLIDVETTCHTLEEELALIAQERDDLRVDLERSQGEMAAQQATQRQVEDIRSALAAAQETQATQASELEAVQVSLRAAENKATALEQEKNRYLDLVNKLQAGINQVDSLKRQLRDQDQQLTKLKTLTKRAPSKRRQRPASAAMPQPMRRRRVVPRSKVLATAKPAARTIASAQAETPSLATRQEPVATNPVNKAAINGHKSTPSVAKRMLSRILGGDASRTKTSQSAKSSGAPSRRHW